MPLYKSCKLLTELRCLAIALVVACGCWQTTTVCAAGEDDALVWRRTNALAAPEARQAAAADSELVYAVTNDRVAKYERRSGQRVAVSTGEAEHLNSAFLWKDHLYCAHSNYPETPEHSRIMRLDPHTMQLDTFHDFGSSEGSLTWAVRHDGSWWCNFAFYGPENKNTYLARYDDQWREQRRWTYPAEVIAEFGRHSSSGGIWRDGHLLVTGHDDPVLYRLRVPAEGDVLELVDRQSVPFSGQGFAHDPKTGGLLGINRRNKLVVFAEPDRPGGLQAGASAVDISPRALPAIRNGGFLEATSDRVDDPLHARCLVLSDGQETLGIAIIDSCMIPRDVCDEIKRRVQQKVGLPVERQLIAATHTHSAPSLMDYCLGSRKDPAYAEYFIPRVVAAIEQAHARLEPAAAGWAAVDAPRHTHSRRWLHRPDAYALDPFGDKTVRAMMHPGYENPAYLGPAGPVDTQLTVLAIRSRDGRPLCVLANYSMHYFGAGGGFSADYFGDFARHLEVKLGADVADAPPTVAIMSQGTSGDLHWMDYSRPRRVDYSRQQYAEELGDLALEALQKIRYREEIPLAMAETRLTLSRRLPSPKRLAWARKIDGQRGDRPPRNQPEVYAQQALWINDHPREELVLQAVRIGELGMAAIPNEVYAITGLKLKAQSPLVPLMNLELANGAAGYIPPPEQHSLGGYTTWPARTAGLEVDAEPKIVEALLTLLEQVSRETRRPLTTDLYTAEQRQALQQARQDDNNHENRGTAVNAAE